VYESRPVGRAGEGVFMASCPDGCRSVA
jgi:hypothetical protein